MRGDRCELCGEPTYHGMTWPGRPCLWHVCVENGCDNRLAKAISASGNREHDWWLFAGTIRNLYKQHPFDWWCHPHANEWICGRIDEEAEKLQRIWRPRGSAVIHADMQTPHGADFRVIRHFAPTTSCAVCGKLRTQPHTFHTKNGYTKVYLCCETEDRPGCCREVTRVWRAVEPKSDAGTQEGLAEAVRQTAANSIMTSGPSVPQDWKAELPRPALQLRPYRGLLFQPGPASNDPTPAHAPTPGVCSTCSRPAHTSAPARDGYWYCETCVGFKTLIADTTARIERRQEEREAARKATPPSAPGRPYRLMGDFYGPKV